MSEVIVSTSRLKRVRAIDTVNDTITVEAGVVLKEIQNAADRADRLFPLSLGAEGSCQIGGNISTNAGGVQVLRYGNMRNLVLGSRWCCPTAASGTACAACARTTPATT
jgi:FAD/FMN-containing dehydrogenase